MISSTDRASRRQVVDEGGFGLDLSSSTRLLDDDLLESIVGAGH